MIDQLTIDKIRDTAQILDVVSEFVTLRRRGQNHVGLCPFHADKSPSFYVSPSKNICKCFSCGEGGDPVHFIMKHEQYNYMEAIRWLAKKYGIEIEEKELSKEEKEAQTAREAMLNLNDFAVKTFEEDLRNTQEGASIGLTYFYERGLQDEIINRYHLGYALEKKDDFATRALAKGHARKYLLDPTEEHREGVGLCYGDDERRPPVCRFAGRVIFPYYSLSGKVVAFGGRILQRVDHAFKKYVNSPESMIYHKGDLLYGIFQAKNDITKRDKCYIVEGNVDVLSMAQAGLGNTVASAGTALTANQIHMIRRFTKNVVLMYDGDEAGIRASLRTIDLLLLEGMNVKLLILPEGEDPDSFCRKNSGSDVKSYFEQHEIDFIVFKTQMLLREAGNDPTKQANVMQNIVQSIALISDPLISSVYVRTSSQMLNVAEAAVLEALKTQRNSNYASELRRMEIEQRRQMAAEGGDISAPQTTTADMPTTIQAETIQAQPSVAAAVASYPRHATDCYELNIITNIVRYGGLTFNYHWTDDEGVDQIYPMRVIDFYNTVLQNDSIVFRHPLYARMLQLATEKAADTVNPFYSDRFFVQHPDPEISSLALDLLDDKYNALGNVEHVPQLDNIIPRAMLELQEALVREQIEELNTQLRTPGVDFRTVMEQIKQLTEIKRYLAKQLGERTIR